MHTHYIEVHTNVPKLSLIKLNIVNVIVIDLSIYYIKKTVIVSIVGSCP